MHKPVLLNEVLQYLNPSSNENFIDCTIGEAGHGLAILEKIKPNGKILGIDADIDSLKRIKPQERLILIEENFKNLKKIIEKYNFYPINGILFDLGLSSWQIEESGRGFSFRKDEPLDMNFQSRAGRSWTATATEIINRWPERELVDIFRKYSEERYGQKIAKKIIETRKNLQIKSTLQLREIIEKAVPFSRTRRGQIDRVLARIFQALRIAVNDELNNLKQGIDQAIEILEPRGKIAVISFHSLEDRIVKNFFRERAKDRTLKILTKKPIIAGEEEIKNNPRARSAKLRAAIKL